jgi:type II secretory pathway pseudopilin PulG
MEVLLTLSILVILGSLTFPSLRKTFEVQKLLKAADQVRMEWTSARVRAMNSGQVIAFRFAPDAAEFTVVPWVDLEPPAAVTGMTVVSGGDLAQSASTPTTTNGKLPDKIRFLAGGEMRQESARDLGFDAVTGALAGDGQNWSQPLFFYPDGRTSSGQVTLANELGRSVVIELRGLTGTAKIHPLGQVAAAAEATP